ncbi:exportin-T-like isoform X2 [Zingiber officinale]|uniref:exportin-T-like isoform X2 n=1 Tax=Zingiber officinale TaxID=94328 RepID=UPI001C4CFA1E|nr:exportin-T-like isoform X2 [Zingiber officinale]
MDDLEKAILLAYEPSVADSTLRAQAIAFCDRVKADASALIRLCLDRLQRSPLVPVQFWCLQALHDVILLRYSSIPPADLPLLRSAMLSLASDRPLPIASPPFLRNKLAQAVAALIRHEYPASSWPDPFLCVLPSLPAADPASIDMFARFLAALDDDLLSLDYPRSSEEVSAASQVKDTMRQQCVPQIARHWYDAVSLYNSSDPSLVTLVLDTMRRYITWIDIGLVANDAFVPLLFDLILAPSSTDQLRAAAGSCVLAIVLKRMDHRQKMALLSSLRLSRIFANPDLVQKVPALVTGYAAEALECYKRLGSADTDGYSPLNLLDEALPSILYVMQESEEMELSNVVAFLSDYVIAMKSHSAKQAMYLSQILEAIRVQILYDPMYRNNLDLPDKIGKEEEDQMGEHRKELLILFSSICRVAPSVTQLFIQNLAITALSSSKSSVEDVEAMLTLFYRLGETIKEEARTGNGSLGELVQLLLSARFPCHNHRLVALIYLETVSRFIKFVQDNAQYIPHVLAVFLDERGIRHPNLNVSRRASYLFMRSVKLLKAKFVPYLDVILQGLQDIVAQFTSSDWSSKYLKCSGSEDGSQTFEAIGLLIGMEDVSPEKQSEYLAALLDPLSQKLKGLLSDAKAQGLEESSAKASTIQQIIMALNALSKGFNERLAMSSRPAIGIMFKKTLGIVLEILVSFPNIRALRNKITSFIHRMVEILGASILPFLPMPLKHLLVENEPEDMVDFLVLANQLICKFSTSLEPILEDIFPAIASRLIEILPRDAFSSVPGCITEEVRELQDLQRTLYTFLHVMANHNLSLVFIAPSCWRFLDVIMQLLLITACSHKDILLRKMCVQIFVKLIKDWCTSCNGDDMVPGFRSFIIEKFAINCCLHSVLDKSFDFRDANSTDDLKAMKSFYHLLIENLRQQQNGSLVFR